MEWQLRWNGRYFQEHFYSSHNPMLFCTFFPFPYPLALQCTHPVWSRALFLGRFDPTELNLGELRTVTHSHRVTREHYWGHSQWNVTVTLSGFTWDPCCRGSFRMKNPSFGSFPAVFHCADKCPVTVAVLESFSGQAVRPEQWQVLGTQEMLFPDLVSNLLGPVLWFKFEHTGCEETKIILQLTFSFQGWAQHKWFVRTYQSQLTTAAQKSSAVVILHLTKVIQKSSQILIIRYTCTRNSS